MPNQNQTADTLRLIQCTVGDETYGLDMSWVRNIQRADRLRPVLEAEADNTAGLVGWLPGHQSNIPVFSLAKRLGTPALAVKGGALQRIIVLPSPTPPSGPKDQGEQLWALLVDHVSQVIQVPTDRFYPLPPVVANPVTNYFEGIIRLEETLILLISPAWLHPDTASNISHSQTTDSESQILTEKPEFGFKEPESKNPKPEIQNLKSSTGRIMIFSTPHPEPHDQILSFGLSLTQVPEILRSRPLIPVPAAPLFVLGLINWRDRPVPVIDLEARLGLTSQTPPLVNGYSRLMIARETFVGFPIESGVQALRLPLAHQPSSQTLALDQNLVKGMVDIEGATLVLPDIQEILNN